jgi:hypothetical protein
MNAELPVAPSAIAKRRFGNHAHCELMLRTLTRPANPMFRNRSKSSKGSVGTRMWLHLSEID